jgi:hypothetical protein
VKFFPKIVSVHHHGAPPQLTERTSNHPRTHQSIAAVMLTLPKMDKYSNAEQSAKAYSLGFTTPAMAGYGGWIVIA